MKQNEFTLLYFTPPRGYRSCALKKAFLPSDTTPKSTKNVTKATSLEAPMQCLWLGKEVSKDGMGEEGEPTQKSTRSSRRRLSG